MLGIYRVYSSLARTWTDIDFKYTSPYRAIQHARTVIKLHTPDYTVVNWGGDRTGDVFTLTRDGFRPITEHLDRVISQSETSILMFAPEGVSSTQPCCTAYLSSNLVRVCSWTSELYYHIRKLPCCLHNSLHLAILSDTQGVTFVLLSQGGGSFW